MRKSLFTILFLIIVLLVPGRAIAQDSASAKRLGLSALLQGSQVDILMPILSGHFSLAPSVGFVWAQDAGTELRLGVVPRIFLSRGKLSPYVGARFAWLLSKPSGGSGTSDWLVGLEFGGEYFVDQHFSIGIEPQLNVTISSPSSSAFGNPGKTNVNTAVAMFATVYF